ncbi:MAG: S8 family serine peptidase [Chryseolinea sp.]
MSKGRSLHIGLNKVDDNHYPGIPTLKAAVNDAVTWEAFARGKGYITQSLHNEQATSSAVISSIKAIRKETVPGDIVLITYAGHGGELTNDKPTSLDNERNDQTWCLYDRQLLDDEIFELFKLFEKGTRVLVISDSCHSGTITRAIAIDLSEMLAKGMSRSAAANGMRSRKLPKEVAEIVNLKFKKKVYKDIQDKYKTTKQVEGVHASVKLLAACQDDEETLDGEKNGIFTENLMLILTDPAYKSAHSEMLIEAVRAKYFFPRPNFFEYGGIMPSFDHGSPFEINISKPTIVTGNREPSIPQVPVLSRKVYDAAWDTIEAQVPAVVSMKITKAAAAEIVQGKEITILEDNLGPNGREITLRINTIPNELAWSAAHALKLELNSLNYEAEVEPILSVNPAQSRYATREADSTNPDYIPEWPPSLLQTKVGIGWHLDAAHSQLANAHEKVIAANPEATVRIGHLDTGYIEGHIALPAKLRFNEGKSFVNGDPNPDKAIDKMGEGQDGHGLGTLTLLAGNKVSKADTFEEFAGFIGGAPFAEIIPIRIAESVVILNANTFCDGLDYAIAKGCEVISMSMAGKPSRGMAKAVNRAYEAGIVMVTAASNCWYKGPGAILPKCVMFPAAFERVIAATGAMYNHQPYDVNFLQGMRFNITTKYMQGSWGPASRMTKALAGYTPNTPWASTKFAFLRSGGGTSSATPQVAAAAALYIAHHRKELDAKGYYSDGQKWKKVEAVRKALFTSAAKDEVFSDWEKYYGNGILRAFDALAVPVADISDADKAPEAESSLWGITEALGSFFKNRRLFRSTTPKPSEEDLALEFVSLLQSDPQFYNEFSDLDLSSKSEVEALISQRGFQDRIQRSPYASHYLKEAILA